MPESDFEDLFWAMCGPAIISDSSGNILDANPSAAAHLFYSRDELKSLTILNIIQGSDRSVMPTISANMKENFVLIEGCHCARKNGSEFPAEIPVSRLRRSDGFVFAIHDTTHLEDLRKKGLANT